MIDLESLRDLVLTSFRRAGVPGGVVHLVTSNGSALSVEYGHLNASTVVALGSTSKAITAAGVMQAVEQGALRLDDPAHAFLRRTSLPKDITVLDLAHHQSGLRTDAVPQRLRSSRRRGFRYANQNYNLLAEIIANSTGEPFLERLQANILAPLNWQSQESAEMRPCATGHTGIFGFNVPMRQSRMTKNSWIQLPSGGFMASAIECGHFLSMMLAGGTFQGRRILEPQSVDQILNNVVIAKNSPAVADSLGPSGEYGLGWVRKNVAGHVIHLHVGKLPQSTSVFVLIPSMNVGFVVLANVGDFLVKTPAVEDLAANIVRSLCEDPGQISPVEGWRRHLILNGVYLLFLGFSLLGWIPREWPGGIPAAMTYHLLLPASLVFGLRWFSSTPWLWLFRFVPDVFTTVMLGSASMLLSGLGRCVWGG